MTVAKEKYFQITVHARSPEELAARVADNELRGFVVARYYNQESERAHNTNTKYKTVDGIYKRTRVNSVYKRYGAVMRRENRDASHDS